jgi:hypothetical protein
MGSPSPRMADLAKTVHACLAAALLLACAGARAQEPEAWSYTGSGGWGYDSNPAASESGNALPATLYAQANLAASLSVRPSGHTLVLLRGSLDGQQYLNYVGLSNGRATLLARGLYRPGGRFYDPTFALWSSAAAWQFGGSMRNSGDYRAGGYISEQLSTAINLRLGGYAAVRRAASQVFDLDNQSATLDADWLLSQRLTLYLGGEFRYGRFAESSPKDPGAAEYAQAKQTDDALSLDGQHYIAYRLQGHSETGSLGLNYALSPRLALDAQAREIHTLASYGAHYNRVLAEISLLARL